MDKVALKTLEYQKIIVRLTELTGSSLGKEVAQALLPSSDFAQVTEWLAETSEGCKVLQTAPNVPLGGMRDMRPLLKKAQLGAILELTDLLDCADALYALRQVKRFFKDIEIAVPKLQHMATSIEILGQLEQQIAVIIDEHGSMRDNASVELQRIRREIRQSQQRIKQQLDTILHSADYQKYFQDVLVTMRGERYVIPIKQEYRQFFPGIVHDQSASGATLFIEPMAIVNLNNDVKQLLAAEKHEVVRILAMITGQIAKVAAILLTNCAVFAKLDFIFAKAKLAQAMNGVAPVINQSGYVDLKQARHPLIAPAAVVPIDIALGKEYTTLLITGPNTGGKTVSMKTLGLMALMVQAGLFISVLPESTIAVFQHIFTDIGDDQSIEQSLSTFSAHMTHLVKILDVVAQDDLLLVDEIGAGTDPEEGAALAMAILEQLRQIGTKVVATTHYSELKTFAYSNVGISNASVEFDITSLRPTYRLLIGVPGSSNAFSISKKLGLSETLIKRARTLIDADHAQFEQILNQLEQEKRIYEQKNAEIQAKQWQVELMDAKVKAMRLELTEKKEKILTKAREDSANLLRKTRRDTEQLITKIKAQFTDQGIKVRQAVFDQTRTALQDGLRAVAVEKKQTRYTKPVDGALNSGDSVYVTSLDQKGTVIAVQGLEVFVQVGIMKITVPLSACMAVEGGTPVKVKSASKVLNFTKVQNVERQIDIRGMLVGDAEARLAKYLDNAILAGLGQVLIIHGKGTGALRSGVRAYLQAHHNVESINIAKLNEGGDGATVVELK